MTFQTYIEKNYVAACGHQHNIPHDFQMIEMLQDGRKDAELVKLWMRKYGLLQGLTTDQRNAVVKGFQGFAAAHQTEAHLTDQMVYNVYYDLFTALYKKVPRGWTSATSKLLWCLYPDQIAIYDTFVHRTLVVLQKIDPKLAGFKDVGTTPKIGSSDDIRHATEHYMNYQAIVQKLYSTHGQTLSELRKKHNESYPYDIRIIDKLLWMIGNPTGTND